MNEFPMAEMPEEIDDIPILQDDMDADEHARKIQYWQNYRAVMIEHLKRQIEAVNAKCDSIIGYHTSLLSNYLHRIPHKITKTQESYLLPCGRMVMTRAHDAIKKPDKEAEKGIIERLKKDGSEELIKVSESLDWQGYKKHLKMDNGKVVDTTTGEIVSDVQIEHVDANLVMRFENAEGENDGTVQDA